MPFLHASRCSLSYETETGLQRNAANTWESEYKIGIDSGENHRLRYAASRVQSRIFMSTFFAKKEEQTAVGTSSDASNQVLGKVAVKAANVLRGKIKPTFTRHVDAGDFVVVVKRRKSRGYRQEGNRQDVHDLFAVPGEREISDGQAGPRQFPGEAHRTSVKGHDPEKSAATNDYKLKVYAGTAHPHTAQKPEPISI